MEGFSPLFWRLCSSAGCYFFLASLTSARLAQNLELVMGMTSLLIPFLLAVVLAGCLVGRADQCGKEYAGSSFDLMSLRQCFTVWTWWSFSSIMARYSLP
jgi:cytochrome bd-type quinol oxidase subunit 2